MPRFLLLLALVLLLGAFSTANAQMVQARAWMVDELISNPNETREEFIWRVATSLQKWTDENGVEACGFMATNGQTWGVKLVTLRNQISCIPDERIVPEGMRAEKDSIHSHPTPNDDGFVYLTKSTLNSLVAMGDNTFSRTRERTPRVRAQYEFSSSDIKAGQGYMVMMGKLMYQNGRRNIQTLGMLEGY